MMPCTSELAFSPPWSGLLVAAGLPGLSARAGLMSRPAARTAAVILSLVSIMLNLLSSITGDILAGASAFSRSDLHNHPFANEGIGALLVSDRRRRSVAGVDDRIA